MHHVYLKGKVTINRKTLNVFFCALSFLASIMMLILDKMRLNVEANIVFMILLSSSVFLYFNGGMKNLKNQYYLGVIYSIFLLLLLLTIISGFDFLALSTGYKFIFFILASFWVSKVFYNNLSLIVFLSSIFLFVFSIFVLKESGWSLTVKMMGMFYNPNSLGMILSVGVFLSLFGVVKLKNNYFYIALLIYFTILCLYSNSRTAIMAPYLSFMSWLIISFFITKRTNKKLTIKSLVDKFLVLLVFLLCVNNDFMVETTKNTIVSKFESKDDVTSGRVDYIIESLKEVKYFSSSEKSSYLIVDNTFIALAYDYGLLLACIMVLVCFLTIFILCSKARRLNNTHACMIFASIINFILYASLESIRFSPQSMLFFIALAFLTVSFNSKEDSLSNDGCIDE